MNFELKTLDLAAAANEKCDALIILVPEKFQAGKDALSILIAQALKAEDLVPQAGKSLQLYRTSAVSAPRLVLVGVADGSAAAVQKAVAAALHTLDSSPAQNVVLVLSQCEAAAPVIQAAVLAAAQATYTYTTTKSQAKTRIIKRVVLGVAAKTPLLQTGFNQATALLGGIEFAKEWGNRPANYATPRMVGEAAKALAKSSRYLRCEVLGPKEVAKLGMGSFMAVAQGSQEPLRFIVLQYNAAPKNTAPTVLVGKGVTFDSGGISIKPSIDMDHMKWDMCGAASIMGLFHTLAKLEPAMHVVGLIPCCENMPSGNAMKPGDVVTSMSGQTIEILNTDAEGRLILCDALTYAERFKPRAVIDVATLTGACVMALGDIHSGLFTNDEQLAQALLQAGKAAMDTCWRMPLDDEYAEGLKSNFADVANIGGRTAGATTAAKFLQRFTKAYPWAHLDIAGVAWKQKYSTGRPVPLLLQYLLTQAAAPAAKAEKASKVVKKSPQKKTGR